MCTSNRDDRKLENTVKQSRFKLLGELHKEWTEAGVSASRVTTLRHLQEKSYQPLLNQKHRQKHLTWAKEKKNWTVAQCSKVLFSDESKLCISFGNQGLEEEWRDTESMLLEVQCEVSTVSDDLAMSSAGVGPLCFIKFKVNAASYQELYGDADCLFQQDLAPAHTAKTTSKCFADHDMLLVTNISWYISQHAWPDTIWDIFMRNSQSNNTDELKAQ